MLTVAEFFSVLAFVSYFCHLFHLSNIYI